MRTYRVKVRRTAVILLEQEFDFDADSPWRAMLLAEKCIENSEPRDSEWQEPERLMDCCFEWTPEWPRDAYSVEEIE